MFNSDVLAQLNQLKQDIRSTKEFAEGVVRGTSKRFGFVVLDDGREAFLNSDEMQRVFPGDRVEVSLTTSKDKNDKDKLEASLEKLIESELSDFVGRYVVRGKGHFVEPDLPQLSRWIFIAPRDRADAAAGDYIRVRITRHPFNCEGKAQAKVLKRIGRDQDIGIEATYTVDKFELPWQFGEIAKQQAEELEELVFKVGDEEVAERRDLTALPFVTIDSESTLDMDDALYAEADGRGWKISVAIADPSLLIAEGTPLELAAREKVNTVYLPGNSLTMLPKTLSHQTFSLVEGEIRPALVCEMQVAEDGSVSAFEFSEALIRSAHKLSYHSASSLLNGDADAPQVSDGARASLKALADFAYARTRYRQEHALVMEDRPDYYPVINAQRKIEAIERHDRTIAHSLVEEAMLATNACAGELLAKHPGMGIFSSHAGFRQERLDEVKSLLKDDRPEVAASLDGRDLSTLEGYRHAIGTLQRNDADCTVLATLKRMLQPGQLTLEPKPHLGLGLAHYATVTSPIRRYNDYYNHLAIKRILAGRSDKTLTDEQVAAMQEQVTTGRRACRQMEQWLYVQFMQQHLGKIFAGRITLVTAAGIGVRLDDFGIEGFVYLAGDRNNKPAFDSRRMKLTHNEQSYVLEQKLNVKVESVDLDSRRINFALCDTE